MANMKDSIIVVKIMKNRVWSTVRFAAFMARRGVLKNRRLVADLDEMMKRRKKSLMFHSNSKPCNAARLGVKEYEFSCSSSPDNNIPGLQFKKRSLLNNFIASLASRIPCICIQETKMDFTGEYVTSDNIKACEFPCYVDDDWRTACSSSPTNSSRWSVEEEEEIECVHAHEVDRQADAFIAKFYSEMELQRQSSLSQLKEMLARGAR